MKHLLCFLLIFIQSIKLFSQEATSYTDFIETDTAIKWAAECDKLIDLTSKTPRFSIKQKLLTTLNDKNLDVYIVNANDKTVTKNIATTVNYQGFEEKFWFTQKDKKLFLNTNCKSSENDLVWATINQHKEILSDSIKLKSRIDIFSVKQILFYKNGKLNIKNVLLNPVVFTKSNSEDTLTGKKLFNVGFDNSNDDNVNTNNLQYISNFNIHYNFNYASEFKENDEQIITLNQSKLIYYFLDDFEAGKLNVIDIKTNTKVPKGKFLTYNIPLDTVPASCMNYYSEEYIVSSRFILPDSLYEFDINQDVFWDSINNKLISKINEVTIYQPYYNSIGICLDYVPLYKVVYKKPFIAISNRDYIYKNLTHKTIKLTNNKRFNK